MKELGKIIKITLMNSKDAVTSANKITNIVLSYFKNEIF